MNTGYCGFLAVVEFFCETVAVMYLGRIVEQAASEQLYRRPLHPYTHMLMSAIPQVDPALRGKRKATTGEVPSALNPPSGCPFHPRCPMAEGICSEQRQTLTETEPGSGHFVACAGLKVEEGF